MPERDHTVEHEARSRYTPDSDQADAPSRWPRWLTRDVSPKDVVLFIIAALMALGFSNPIRRIAALETRVGGLEESQRFTNYLLCTQLRRTDPAATPSDCVPVFESRKPK